MPFFDIFASPRWSPLRMRTKVVSFFNFFQELSNKKKFKALRPKMTKIASRGSCLKTVSTGIRKVLKVTVADGRPILAQETRTEELCCSTDGFQWTDSMALIQMHNYDVVLFDCNPGIDFVANTIQLGRNGNYNKSVQLGRQSPDGWPYSFSTPHPAVWKCLDTPLQRNGVTVGKKS